MKSLAPKWSRDQWLRNLSIAALIVIVGTGSAFTNWVAVVMCMALVANIVMLAKS